MNHREHLTSFRPTVWSDITLKFKSLLYMRSLQLEGEEFGGGDCERDKLLYVQSGFKTIATEAMTCQLLGFLLRNGRSVSKSVSDIEQRCNICE